MSFSGDPQQANARNRWFLRLAKTSDAPVNLYALAYAGGSASVFREWPGALAESVQVIPVQLPGRGSRFGEPLVIDPAAVANAIRADADRPFVLFGHSMGGLVAFEAARLLSADGGTPPAALIVSAVPAPRLRRKDDKPRDDSDEALMAWSEKLHGSLPEALRHVELRELLLPILRADLAWLEAYRYQPGPLLGCPLTALIGTEDWSVRAARAAGWAEETTGPFTLKEVPGGHLFLHESQDVVLNILSDLARGE